MFSIALIGVARYVATGCARFSCSPVFVVAWNPLNSTHNHATGGAPCMRGAALPLFQPLIVSFFSWAVVSRPLKSQRILNQHDSEQAALAAGR